ncbi:MAG: hypothetical protein ABWW65_00690 [Thermoprotei archaeon]
MPKYGETEIKYHNEIDSISDKLKTPMFQAYVNIYGDFLGIIRKDGDEITDLIDEIIKSSRGRCTINRINLKHGEGWDEGLILLCNEIVIASYSKLSKVEYCGKNALEEIVKKINKGIYAYAFAEITEISEELVEKYLGVPLKKERSVETGERKEETLPQAIIEEETLPIEASTSDAETVSEKEVLEEKSLSTSELDIASEERGIRLEEVIKLDRAMLSFMDKLVELSDKENIYVSSAIIRCTRDRLEVEVFVSKLGLSEKEKMLEAANNILNIISSILEETGASQREIYVIVKHGYTATVVKKQR